MENLIKLTKEESEEIAKKLWESEKMQKYLVDKYDFYKTKDNLIIELEKVKKITIDKTMYYDDETEAPKVTKENFVTYNRYNIPGRNLEEYIQQKESLKKNGVASGQYDYKGIYFVTQYYNNVNVVSCNWFDKKDERYFKRYLTEDEEKDFINLMEERKKQYIERLEKYFERYGKNITTYGYWANR